MGFNVEEEILGDAGEVGKICEEQTPGQGE